MAKKREFFSEEGGLGVYHRDIAKHDGLSKEEERVLAERIREGDQKALDKLVTANLKFVVSVARNYQNQGMPLADLINEGNLGLIRAASRFDEKKDFKFISYAVWWIRQAILQGLADHSRVVKVPLNKVALIYQIEKARKTLEVRWGRLPNEEEVAQYLDKSIAEVKSVALVGNRATSLDAPLSTETGSGTRNDFLVDEFQDDTDSLAETGSLTSEVFSILSVLNEREQDVVHMYYGVGQETNYTLEEIGNQLDITRERVRQIKDGALRKLSRSGKALELMQNTLSAH